MFARNRRVVPGVSAPAPRVHTVAAVVADPDTPNLHRQRGLRHVIGLGLQGYSGVAIGYDKGDPAHSLQTVMQSASSPTAAIANVGRLADANRMATPSEFSDMITTDPSLDPYQALLWYRLGR